MENNNETSLLALTDDDDGEGVATGRSSPARILFKINDVQQIFFTPYWRLCHFFNRSDKGETSKNVLIKTLSTDEKARGVIPSTLTTTTTIMVTKFVRTTDSSPSILTKFLKGKYTLPLHDTIKNIHSSSTED